MDKYVKIGNFDGYDTKLIYWYKPRGGWERSVGYIQKCNYFGTKSCYKIYVEIVLNKKVYLSNHFSLSDAQKEAKRIFSNTDRLMEAIDEAMLAYKADILSEKTGNKEVKQ